MGVLVSGAGLAGVPGSSGKSVRGGDPLFPILVAPGKKLGGKAVAEEIVLLWESLGNTHTLALHLGDKERIEKLPQELNGCVLAMRAVSERSTRLWALLFP